MSKEDRSFWAAAFFVIPFLVSAAWWVSPWLGVPSLVVGLVLWAGILLEFSDSAKKKAAEPKIVVNTTHHFSGTHDERMARIREAATKAAQRAI